MSLIHCPECGHETSTSAVACANCGRPIHAVAAPIIERNVVVAEVPQEDGGFPPWAFIPLGILGAALLLILFYAMSRNDDTANSNVSVKVETNRSTVDSRGPALSDSSTATESQTITVPSTETQTLNVPGSQTSVSNPPASATTGTVTIDAKIASPTGAPQAVRNEKFYLLDKDLESILNDADLEVIEGQSLANSFGLSVMYPERFGDFNRQALRAINRHIKYTGQTDSSGKAQLGGIAPDSYYLFGITKAGKGFALWSSPVTINTGQNVLNLSPQRVTEMVDSSG